MAETGLVFDVTDADFDRLVLEASHERPVVVDFWAPWCGPCLVLGPLLERVIGSLAGRASLAKVNVDQNPRLAGQWRIQSIPLVKVFRNGEVVKDLLGALPEAELRRQLGEVIPSETDDLVAEGDRLAEQGKPQLAEAKYRQALETDSDQSEAAVKLAEMALERGDIADARDLMDRVRPAPSISSRLEALEGRIWLAERCKDSGLLEACRQRLASDPDDLAARFYLGCCLAAERKYQDALDELLAVVRADKRYDDGAATQAMVHIFAILGQSDELARRYRALLSRELYV
jgi:putative thioredoxin